MEPNERLSASDSLEAGHWLFYDDETEIMTPTEEMPSAGWSREEPNLGAVDYPTFTSGDGQQVSRQIVPSTDDQLPDTRKASPDIEEGAGEDTPPFQRGCVQMTVDGREVSMRKFDYWFNATEIQLLAGMTQSGRQPNLWVCYEDCRFLCEFYGLTDTLRQLLEYPPKDIKTKAQQASRFINVPTGTVLPPIVVTGWNCGYVEGALYMESSG
jgi:hypothetical protein